MSFVDPKAPARDEPKQPEIARLSQFVDNTICYMADGSVKIIPALLPDRRLKRLSDFAGVFTPRKA